MKLTPQRKDYSKEVLIQKESKNKKKVPKKPKGAKSTTKETTANCREEEPENGVEEEHQLKLDIQLRKYEANMKGIHKIEAH